MTVFSVGVLSRLGLEPRIIGQQGFQGFKSIKIPWKVVDSLAIVVVYFHIAVLSIDYINEKFIGGYRIICSYHLLLYPCPEY